MSNFLKKLFLVLAQSSLIAVIALTTFGLLSSVNIKPNEIGVMENKKTGEISSLEQGFHAWLFDKNWNLFSSKVTIFSTDEQFVCVDKIPMPVNHREQDGNVSYRAYVCSHVTVNPDNVTSLYFLYDDSDYSDFSVEQNVLIKAVMRATYSLPADLLFEDRDQVEDEIKSFFEKKMKFGNESMMWIESVEIMQVIVDARIVQY